MDHVPSAAELDLCPFWLDLGYRPSASLYAPFVYDVLVTASRPETGATGMSTSRVVVTETETSGMSTEMGASGAATPMETDLPPVTTTTVPLAPTWQRIMDTAHAVAELIRPRLDPVQ